MDVNDYQPLGVKILSSLQGYTTPEILDDAKRGNLNEELQVNKGKVGDLLDGRIPSSNPQNEVYKLLLTGVCNHLHKTFPFLFERIDDYTELLLPDDLTSEFSIIQDIRNGMSKEDCEEVEIIGWLYQFYISEKKDEVFASKDKVKKEDIPAATQLFTPRWIVEYMVQNTVGKLWLRNNPTSRLKDQMPYYIESEEKDHDYLKVSSVEEITLLDQACGSGHILVYGFELFSKIYEEQGYNQSEIPELIINKNLFGFEIDERAAQLSGFALLMKAREYHRRVFRKELKPNILCYKDLKLTEDEIKETFRQLKIKLKDELLYDFKSIQQATNLGSLIRPHLDLNFLKEISEKIRINKDSSDVFMRYRLEELDTALNQLKLLANKYHCIVDNPPYMGGGKMNNDVSNWVKFNYPNSKSDLMTCFMEAGINSLLKGGYVSMINIPSWLTLMSYGKLRLSLIQSGCFKSVIHNGRGVFGSDFGSIAFTYEKGKKNNTTIVKRLFSKFSEVESNEEKVKKFKSNYGEFKISFSVFEHLPDNIFAYWLNNKELDSFINLPHLNSFYPIKQGMATGENDRFLRFWHEVEYNQIEFNAASLDDAINASNKRYFPYNKGGEFRKWYGNNDYVIRFDRNQYEVLNTQGNKIPSKDYQLKESITWSKVTAGGFSLRFRPKGSFFDVSGCSIFSDGQNLLPILALMNSDLNISFLENISTSVNFEVGQIKSFPLNPEILENEEISSLASECINISKIEWDSWQSSWDHKKNFLNEHFSNVKLIEEAVEYAQQYWSNKFDRICVLESDINTALNVTYGLKQILPHEVNPKKITLLKTNRIAFKHGSYSIDHKELIVEYIHYSVGSMFGRYSLDKEGLILANQGETLQDYLVKVEKKEPELSFFPDEDNIIPILDDEWFEDDIVGRFYAFLKASFGEQNFEKNLSFVEESIGKDIRKYFVKDFYKDHIKRYKKRPIYWMFSSPKGSFNVLVYMHRYTPDTLNQVLNGYLNEYREKLKTRIETLDHLMVSGSPSEQNKASKEKDKIQLVLLELQEYEREILYPLATERISIDLDDGVLVNYNKFGKAIASVAGLNDKKAKEKVRKFDWIDTTTIR